MHHLRVRLPDGRHACANWDDPIVPVMRRILAKVAEARPGELAGEPGDYAKIAAWLDDNTAQSSLCMTHACGHTA